MKKQFWMMMLLLFIGSTAFAQFGTADKQAKKSDLTAKVPVDKKVKVGKLDNGLTYYVRNLVIAKGGSDEETKKALQKAQADLQDVQNKYAELNTKYENDKVAHQKELFNVKIDQELSQATAGLKFIANLPETAIVELKKQAIQRVKGYTPEYIDDGNGGKVLSFSQNGVTMRNPETNLKPYTAAELIQKELKTMGVLEVQRIQKGAGSQDGQGDGQGDGAIADLSGARTQNEAYEVYAKQLMSQGLINGSKEFDDAMKKAWADNIDTIKTLPKQ